MMIIQGIIKLGYHIRSAWFLDIRISTCYLYYKWLECTTLTIYARGGGTGPADPAAARPIIYSEITTKDDHHHNLTKEL